MCANLPHWDPNKNFLVRLGSSRIANPAHSYPQVTLSAHNWGVIGRKNVDRLHGNYLKILLPLCPHMAHLLFAKKVYCGWSLTLSKDQNQSFNLIHCRVTCMIAPECLHLRIHLLNAFTYDIVIPIHCKFIKINMLIEWWNKWVPEEVAFYYKHGV